uniref:Protein kinase domain-containing protein n=1 Tax=viral metagenome TaxID=1070528 RepID=A0A6C0ER69_9ZZZZ
MNVVKRILNRTSKIFNTKKTNQSENNSETTSNSSKKSSSSSSKKSSSSSSSKKSSSSSSKKSSSSRKSNKTEKIDKSKIKKLLSANIQNRSENLGKMLEVTCKNPDNCIALGYYGDVIKRYFDNFQNLDFIDNTSLKRIGRESKNGFIIEVPFKKNNFTAYTALKCSSDEDSDNLLYEYYVGKYFINKYAKMYPCFVETYDLYEFKSLALYENMKIKANSDDFSNTNFKYFIEKVYIDDNEDLEDIFDYSCLRNKLLCVLIQHFDKFVSFHDALKNFFDKIRYDIYNMIYQVYFALAMLGNNYTHYDLHANNVFLYKPFNGNKCILMRYHHNGKVFEFKSEYIMKIIDYGRNYFNNGKTNTKEIMEKICKQKHCQPRCGETKGYNYVQGNIMDPNFNFHWINPIVSNVSHDLKFADYVKKILNKYDFIKNVYYETEHGTPENTFGDEKDIRSIFNLLDAMELKLNDFNYHKNQVKYANWTVAAEMDVYDDGREYTFNVLPVP